MPDVDTMLQTYFDAIAPPVDVEAEIARRSLSPPAPAARWWLGPVVAGAAAVVVLVVIGLAALLSADAPPPVTETPTTTAAPTPTLDATGWGRTPFGDPVLAVRWIGGRFVAVGETERVWLSADGVEWRPALGQLGIDDVMFDVSSGGPGLVAVGIRGGSEEWPVAVVWTSVDGEVWTQLPHDEAVFGVGSSWMHSVVEGGPGLVAVGSVCADPEQGCGYQPAAWVSEDGLVWTRTVLDGSGNMRDVTILDDGTLIAVGRQCENLGLRDLWAPLRPEPATGPGRVDETFADCDAAVWTSTDGVEWTTVEDLAFLGPGTLRIDSVAVRGSVVVAVGTSLFETEEAVGAGWVPSGIIWTSTDGSAWNRVINLTGASMRDVTVGGSGFVAVGAGNAEGDRDWMFPGYARVWTSPDGRVWTEVEPYEEGYGSGPLSGGPAIDTVAAGPERIVAFGFEDLWASPPPGEWTSTPTPVTPETWVETVYPAEGFEAPGWRRFATDPTMLGGEGFGALWQHVIAGPDGYLAWGYTFLREDVEQYCSFGGFCTSREEGLPASDVRRGATWTSSDGVTWTRHEVAEIRSVMVNNPFHAGTIVADPSGFIGAGLGRGEEGGAYILNSPDGAQWTSTRLGTGPDVTVFDVARGESGLVAVGQGDAWISTDGIAWEQTETFPASSTDVVAFGSGFVAVGPYRTWLSPDGVTWTQGGDLPELDGGYIPEVELLVLDGTLIVVGHEGEVWTSPNGLEWTLVHQEGFGLSTDAYATTAWTGDLGVVAYGRDARLEVTGSYLYLSPDGIVWQQLEVPPKTSTVAPFGDKGIIAAVPSRWPPMTPDLGGIELWVWEPPG